MPRGSAIYILAGATLLMLQQGARAAQAGAVSGTVVTDAGAPVTDAAVQLFTRIPGDLQPKLSNGAVFTLAMPMHGPLAAATNAGAAGAFQISSVANGEYVVCAHSRAGAYLDNCVWNNQFTAVQVAGSAAAPVTIALHAAATLLVHVNDTSGALAASAGIPRDLAVSVTQVNGSVVPLNLIASSAAGRDYEAPIPFDTSVHLCIASSSVRLADSTGRALAASVSMPVIIASTASGARQQLTFNILGAK